MSDFISPPSSPLPPPTPSTPVASETEVGETWPKAPARRPHRPGQLDATWRAITVATWIGVFVAYLGVWKASEEIGLSTWWLGSRSNPQPLVIQLVPFFVAALFGSLASYNVRRLPWITLVGALVLAVIAVGDRSRSVGLATVEFAIAAAVLLVALGSFTGTYRAPPEQLDR